MIKKLKWDSNFFGFNVALINIANSVSPESFSSILKRFWQSEHDCAYLSVPVLRKDLLKLCTKNNLYLADIRVLLEKQIMTGKHRLGKALDSRHHTFGSAGNSSAIGSTGGGGIIVRQIKKKDKEDLLKLAGQISKKSRFYKDKKFRKFADKLFGEWIVKSVYKKNNPVNFFAYTKDELAGMITVKLTDNIPFIDLFGVLEKYRRYGFGKKLLDSVFYWAEQNNYAGLKVNTQKTNKVAMIVYQKSGFKILNTTNIYHLWKKDD